ncbi:DUF6992 family protein [Fodinibius sp.]|uniref:DUF6992 family protein n=1 Tax=Fodinibius sp. TaxID=1872440 RepID=UPI002ACEA049|nr:hypothetical protein [Fodinibius sp.]MDZ7658386.1 hypothetical protein [Fodinibius sp.]
MVIENKQFQLSILLTALLFLVVAQSPAQTLSDSLTSFNEQRINLNTNGMYVLSGWALTNIAVGSIGYFKSTGSTKYLHQMNVGWNIVNLAIAGGALYQSSQVDPTSFTLAQSIAEAKSIENILLLNMGLNVGYIATGGFMWERGLRKTNNRLVGYGQSLIIQGGFLLLFDSTLYLLNRSNNEQLQSIIETISIQGSQLTVSIPL